jgi:hypothetical protein
MLSDQLPFWLLFPLQTGLLYWLGCKAFGRNIGADYDSAIHVWLPTVGVVVIALLMGAPLWRDQPFGDAYDFGAATFLMTALSGRLAMAHRMETLIYWRNQHVD